MTDRLIRITTLAVMAVAAVAAVISLLMVLIRTGRRAQASAASPGPRDQAAPPLKQEVPLALSVVPTLEQIVRGRYEAGHSQRAIARELNINRRKVKRIVDRVA